MYTFQTLRQMFLQCHWRNATTNCVETFAPGVIETLSQKAEVPFKAGIDQKNKKIILAELFYTKHNRQATPLSNTCHCQAYRCALWAIYEGL